MTTRLRFLPMFAFFFFNLVLSVSAFSMEEPLVMKMDDSDPSRIYVTFSPQVGTSSLLRKLRSEEMQRLQSAQTPEEKYKLGREFAFEKFGHNLLQDERDQIAVSLFEASGTSDALGRLGYLYKEDRTGLNLPEGKRYARALELLEKDNSPWALSTIGDMYRFGRFEHKERRFDIEHYPNYNSAASYYRKSRTGYAWYALGYSYAKSQIEPDTCCASLSQRRAAHRCFDKARELGYEIPKQEERACGSFFLAGTREEVSSFGGCCMGWVACCYLPCCIGYGCAESIPEDRL